VIASEREGKKEKEIKRVEEVKENWKKIERNRLKRKEK
jgi:hypothetical protein